MKSKITKYILKLSKERDYALSEITNHVCVDDKKIYRKMGTDARLYLLCDESWNT